MTEPEQRVADEQLVEYLRANRERYNREVLTNKAIREGYTRDDVAAAWRVADADAAAREANDGLGPRRARQGALSAIAVLLAFGAFAVGEFALIAASGGRPAMLLYVILYPIQIILVTRWIVGKIGSSGDLRRGDAVATVGWLVVPVVALLAIMGVCYGYGASFGCILEC